MNHADVTHCEDYRKSYCPKSCNRARLTQDLLDKKARGELPGIPMSFAKLRGTDECLRKDAKSKGPLKGNI